MDEALTRPCGASVGACRAGTQRCAAGALGGLRSVGPSGEQCNRADDDCDGATDEGVTNACGGCGAVPAEACDGVDQDCDGRVDEQVVGPVPAEACNGRDDDCDGRADEGLGPDCRPCAVSADCNDSNGCTDDRCEAGRCVFTANQAACEDGVFCNGTDRCQGGLCQLHTPRDCGGVLARPPIGVCVPRAGGLPGRGTGRLRPVHLPHRVRRAGHPGAAGGRSRAARAGCAREASAPSAWPASEPSREPPAPAGVCLAGVCTPQRTITARLDGDFTLAGRARVACVQGGQACVATWGAACSVTAPRAPTSPAAVATGAPAAAPIRPRTSTSCSCRWRSTASAMPSMTPLWSDRTRRPAEPPRWQGSRSPGLPTSTSTSRSLDARQRS
ncbi:MAG: MopE-related protein [bacterium]